MSPLRSARCSSPASREYIDFPKARYGQHQVDRVLRDGTDVGISHDVGYITNEHAFVSLASIETGFGGAGNRGGGRVGRRAQLAQARSRAPPCQVTIRATVQPAPYSAFARENYRKS